VTGVAEVEPVSVNPAQTQQGMVEPANMRLVKQVAAPGRRFFRTVARGPERLRREVFDRGTDFGDRSHDRYWWHQRLKYEPPLYTCLTADEWAHLEAWYQETEQKSYIGEAAVPLMSVAQGFVMGSGMRNWVQLGVYAGYSMLLGGFMMRRMGFRNALFGIDIDESMVAYTRDWIERCGLTGYAHVACADSAAPEMPAAATSYFGSAPRVVLIDSSHQYAHTLLELDLWSRAVAPGGVLLLHDTSLFAAQYDSTKQGGVHRAFAEWSARNPTYPAININGLRTDFDPLSPDPVYCDGCGVGIIQRPMPGP
jgi:predicted O-methyltransferase YrrM